LAGAANATSGRAVSANNVAQNSGLPAASPSTGPARAAERSATRQHVVQRGENFWSIARTYYGSGSAYLALWYANRERVNSPEALAVGTSLRIPPMDELDRSMIEAVSTVAPNNARPKSAAAPAQPILSVGGRTDRNAIKPVDPSQRYHVVGASETLRSIARDELGDSSRELEIRRMNRDLLGESDRPQVGMRLRLPDETRRR
jgi:nucleoid-associated protein YgaU